MMVYDYHNSEIGFYDKDNVIYLGSGEPPKVELHDYEPEDDPVTPPTPPKKDDPKKQNPKEDIFRPISDIINKGKKKSKPVEQILFIQTLLYYFILAVAACILIFLIYLYIRHKRKTHFPGAEYFIKESQKFEGGSLNEMS